MQIVEVECESTKARIWDINSKKIIKTYSLKFVSDKDV